MEPVYAFCVFVVLAVLLWVRSTRGVKPAKLQEPVRGAPDYKALMLSARSDLDTVRTRLNELEGQLAGAYAAMQEIAPGAALVVILTTGSVEDAEAAVPGTRAFLPAIYNDPQLREILLELLPLRRQRLIEELTDITPDVDSADCTDFLKSVSRCKGAASEVGPEPTRPVEPRELKRQWGSE